MPSPRDSGGLYPGLPTAEAVGFLMLRPRRATNAAPEARDQRCARGARPTLRPRRRAPTLRPRRATNAAADSTTDPATSCETRQRAVCVRPKGLSLLIYGGTHGCSHRIRRARIRRGRPVRTVSIRDGQHGALLRCAGGSGNGHRRIRLQLLAEKLRMSRFLRNEQRARVFELCIFQELPYDSGVSRRSQ